MLDPEAVKIARDMIDSEYSARSQRFRNDVQRTQSELANRGLGNSGALLEAVADACAHEVESSAERAWEILRETLVETRVRGFPDLAAELKKAFEVLFSYYCMPNAEGTLNSTRMTAGGSIEANAATLNSFQGRSAGARQGVCAKIDRFVYSLGQSVEANERVRTGVFLSHAASDEQIGRLLKEEIERRLPGVNAFCSSDPTDLPPGSNWPREILRALQESSVLIFVASDRGLERRWVWFECGTFWFSGRRMIPICLGEVRKNMLRPPLSDLQAVNGDQPEDLRIVFDSLAVQTGVPIADATHLEELAERLRLLDRESAAATKASEGWEGVEWEGKFLAYDGPYEDLRLIEDAHFEMSMQEALVGARYRVTLYDQNNLTRLSEGGHVVHLTDRRSWRRRVAGNGGWLVAHPGQA